MERRIDLPLILSFFVLFSSCKIISLKETDVIAETCPYDLAADSIQWSNSLSADRTKWLAVDQKIVGTNDSVLLNSDQIILKRKFIPLQDSLFIECFTYTPPHYKHIVVFFIGRGSRHTEYVSRLVQLSIETNSKVVSWNYRGYGKSSGRFSFKTQFEDNRQIYRELIAEEPKYPVSVIGYSLGTVFAGYLANEEQIAQLALLAPVTTTKDFIKYLKHKNLKGLKCVLRPFVRIKVDAKDKGLIRIDNIDCVRTYKNRLLIVQAKDDAVLPFQMGKKLYNYSVSSDKQLISPSHGGHGAPMEQENWAQLIKWIHDGY